MRSSRASPPRCASAMKRGVRNTRSRTRSSGATSKASNIGYTLKRSPSRTRYEKSTDTPLTRISSTSVCGTPIASIAFFTVAARAHENSNSRLRRRGAMKSFNSS